MSDEAELEEFFSKIFVISAIAKSLFDNKSGESSQYGITAPRELWRDLGVALYGAKDSRVKELNEGRHPDWSL